MTNQNKQTPEPQLRQTAVMFRFVKDYPDSSYEDYKKYYEDYINEKFDEYKQKQLKILNKDLK